MPNPIDEEIYKPSAWFRSVQKNEDVNSTHMWSINKEKIYNSYNGNKKVYYGVDGKEFLDEEPTCNHIKYSHKVLVLPTGKIITPIRQFCETKVLPAGTKEAFFFDFGEVNFNPQIEGEEPQPTTPTIRSSGVESNPRGTRITIGYGQRDESPIDIIASVNRSFSLESISDENNQILNMFNVDDGLNTTTLKPTGGGNKIGRWVNGNGKQITNDSDIDEFDPLTKDAIFEAVGIIAEEGLDVSNVVLYTTGDGLQGLLESCNCENEYELQKILGVKILTSGACPTTATKLIDKPESIFTKIKRVLYRRERELITIGGKGRRSVLFIPNVAFGLIVGRDLIMEAQRRNELQAIHLTGTQKIAGLVKNIEACVRISHY